MAIRGGRIVCPRCGANNFDTVTACWRCSASLASALPGPLPAAPSLPDRAANAQAMAPPAVPQAGSPAAASRAAMWLGLLFPYFGIPVGLAFIMCEDRRRQEIGRQCILWSLLSTFIHLLLLFVMVMGMRAYFDLLFDTLRGQFGRPGGMGAGL